MEHKFIEELVDANHIIYKQGVVDGFGHISARHPDNPGHFLMSRSLAPSLVRAEDIMEFDVDSNVIGNQDRKPYSERFIHGEIYKAREDVMAVVHSHSQSVVPFTVVASEPLRAICHMSGFIGMAAPIFEIRDVVGDTSDLLVRDMKLGAALAKVLGKKAVVLMRGHGLAVVGGTIKQTVFRAVYTEVNARLQRQALQLGNPTYLSDVEALNASLTNDGGPTALNRAWGLWLQNLQEKD